MPNFNPEFKNFAILMLKLHGTQVKTWSEDQGNPELSAACLMLMDAGKQAQQGEK